MNIATSAVVGLNQRIDLNQSAIALDEQLIQVGEGIRGLVCVIFFVALCMCGACAFV